MTETSLDPELGNPAWVDNWTPDTIGLRMEIMHLESRSVWLCQAAVSPDEYERLRLPPGWVKLGIGQGVHDMAFFRRSPGAGRDGPVEVTEIDGHRFSFVARPGEREPDLVEVMVLPVDKHHSVLFRAGRHLEILDAGDGWDYVPQTAPAGFQADAEPVPAPRDLPAGWSSRWITLEKDLLVDVPKPARVVFFSNGDSFQGPVRLAL